jgi:hypothetical protein
METRTNQLRDGENKESRVVKEVAPPEPSWLRQKTEQPFQAASLHPTWRLRFRASQEIERGPDAEHDGLNAPGMCSHPKVLLGTA